ncbi:hypothetical protein LCL97_19340 [Seohaeicola saemankumensis]|nr:hypothetical protein [Seohaeicola saemankumensis]MCA0872989.1 hypothetical protein [Seohaeicola saemankumensis]
MSEPRTVPRNLTLMLEPQHGWAARFDNPRMPLEACLHTEGYIDFLHDGQVSRQCWFLLEFFLETKTSLLRHFSTETFTAKIALPLSGSGFVLIRERETVTASLSGEVIMSSGWRDFLRDFRIFQTALEKELRRQFPAMSSSEEFALLF